MRSPLVSEGIRGFAGAKLQPLRWPISLRNRHQVLFIRAESFFSSSPPFFIDRVLYMIYNTYCSIATRSTQHYATPYEIAAPRKGAHAKTQKPSRKEKESLA
jgi:hypothetical protein